jgi:hypothetical protein
MNMNTDKKFASHADLDEKPICSSAATVFCQRISMFGNSAARTARNASA